MQNIAFRRKDECSLLDTNARIDAHHSELPERQLDPLSLTYIEGINSMRATQVELITNATILGRNLNSFCNLRRKTVILDTAESESERQMKNVS